jgi:putative FmdB family regulatory protein
VFVPTYSYECTECGNRFDKVQSFTEDSLTTCEQCSGRLRKLFNSVGVVFKGSGFYRTDSRESGQKSKSSTNGSSSGDSDNGSGSSESKSSGSSESKSSGSSDKASTSAASSSASSN